MRKKFFGIAIVAAIAVTTGWNMNENEIKLSDIAFENIEALAYYEYEIPGTYHVHWYWQGSFDNLLLNKNCWPGGTNIC